jgi:hypothetical protein
MKKEGKGKGRIRNGNRGMKNKGMAIGKWKEVKCRGRYCMEVGGGGRSGYGGTDLFFRC